MEKRLRRDLRRTHALLSDVQLLLGTMEDGKASVSQEELEKVHSQVGVLEFRQNRAGEGAVANGEEWLSLPGCAWLQCRPEMGNVTRAGGSREGGR